MPKAIFIDTSRCTACRGCQIACKEWNGLPPNQTKQRGSHQNPEDLNPNNYKLVRFSEYLDGTTIRWVFFPDQCRHCQDPPCIAVGGALVEGAMFQDPQTGAVVYTEKTSQISEQDFEEIREACPYNIPRRNPTTGQISKCTMCFDRISHGLVPSCVKACPTGAMNFGDYENMLALAKSRLETLQKTYPKSMLADADSVNVIYLMTDDPKRYHEFSVAQQDTGISRSKFLAHAISPFKRTLESLLQG
jgi:formate dehydrogenase iron-sulfur subunit